MSIKSICASIELIEERIDIIDSYLNEVEDLPSSKVYQDAISKNLIEIGEESKIVNDILNEEKGSWDDVISKSYNLRISLTHYYTQTSYKTLMNYLNNDFLKFKEKIIELKNEFGC